MKKVVRMTTSPSSGNWVPSSRRPNTFNFTSKEIAIDEYSEEDASDWDDLSDKQKDERRRNVTKLADLPDEYNSFVVGCVVKEGVSKSILFCISILVFFVFMIGRKPI